MAIKISGETVVDDSKKGLFNDVVVKGGAGESGEITLNCENNSHGVKLKGPAHSAGADYTLTLPDTSGNSGEVLTTDGSGVMSWEEVVGNEISNTAPTSPSQGALWTDTSADPAVPILKTWNGSAWVAVGSASPTEFAPVINNVTLTENDTTGDRFTSQSFDVNIDMLVEGNPHSQKALKGEVTAEFSEHPNTEAISSNAVIAYPNTTRTSTQIGKGSNSYYTRVWAPNSMGGNSWYLITGDSSNNYYVWENSEPGYHGTGASQIYYGSVGGSHYPRRSEYFAPGGTNDKHYVITSDNHYQLNDHLIMRKTADTDSWYIYTNSSHISHPAYNPETGHFASVRTNWGGNPKYWITLQIGTTPFGNDIRDYTWTYNADSSGHEVAYGNGKLCVAWKDSYNNKMRVTRFTLEGTHDGEVSPPNVGSGSLEFFKFEKDYFWMQVGNNFYRSSDGQTWTQLSVHSNFYRAIDVKYQSSTNKYLLISYSGTNNYVFDSNNGGSTWVERKSISSGVSDLTSVHYGDSKIIYTGYNNSYYFEQAYPYNKQTLTLSGTGADYSDFNVGDSIRPAGQYDLTYRGVINSISGADFEISSDYVYQTGDIVEAVNPTNSQVSTRYLVIDATGNVSGTVASDPGYVSVGPSTSQTLTFPATMDTGNAPDDELAAGTTIKVSAQATNSEGSSEYGPSNIVTPS